MTERTKEAEEAPENPKRILKDAWAIRPCSAYKDEYKDCTSLKARFHQYFIHGEMVDCSQWHTDYQNCVRYQDSNGNNVEAGEAVIRSEEERRLRRLHAYYANTTWEKRKSPPENWAKPLPEFFAKRNENTYLQLKQMELEGKSPVQDQVKSFCSIM